jgi:hypothetical protein
MVKGRRRFESRLHEKNRDLFKFAPLSRKHLQFAGLPAYMMNTDGDKVKGIAPSYPLLN